MARLEQPSAFPDAQDSFEANQLGAMESEGHIPHPASLAPSRLVRSESIQTAIARMEEEGGVHPDVARQWLGLSEPAVSPEQSVQHSGTRRQAAIPRPAQQRIR